MALMHYFLEHSRYLNLLGIALVIGLAYFFSTNRRAIAWKRIGWMGAVHASSVFFFLKFEVGRTFIGAIAHGAAQLYKAAEIGAQFVFGPLAAIQAPWGFIFAFRVLPITIFFSALTSLLLYWGVIGRAVRAVGKVLMPIFGTSAPESMCAVANSFLGQTEAPLLIRRSLARMTSSEIFVVMVSGMGTISAALLAVYAALGVPAQHLLISSFISIPATLLIAKVMHPETEREAKGVVSEEAVTPAANSFDAIGGGTSDGLMLALNIGAALIVFLSLIGVINGMLGALCVNVDRLVSWMGGSWHVPCLTLESILGTLGAPFAYLLGIAKSEILAAGQLLGIKVAANEMIAFDTMVKMSLSPRTVDLLTYVLCGFSNFSCIGIQISGIGGMAPSIRGVLSRYGIRAVFAAALANLFSAYMVGLFL